MSLASVPDYDAVHTSDQDHVWLHRFAMAIVAWTFLLIVAGGNVTSKQAGLSVADWPLSFGSINPPGWIHMPLVRDEHGHRLIGVTLGLLVIILTAWLRLADSRTWVRRMGYLALVGVIVQGVLGGLRVTEKSSSLAVVHGCFAQAFFCLTIAIALATSPWFRSDTRRSGATDEARSRPLRIWTAMLVGCVYGQLMLGAITRHLSSGYAAIIHVIGALAVGVCLVMAAQYVFARPESERQLVNPTMLALLMYGLQLLLGVMSYVLVMPLSQRKPLTAMQALAPTAHVAVGAIILGLSFAIAFRAFALTRPRLPAAQPSTEVGG